MVVRHATRGVAGTAPAVRNVKTSLVLRNSKDAAMVPLELKS